MMPCMSPLGYPAKKMSTEAGTEYIAPYTVTV